MIEQIEERKTIQKSPSSSPMFPDSISRSFSAGSLIPGSRLPQAGESVLGRRSSARLSHPPDSTVISPESEISSLSHHERVSISTFLWISVKIFLVIGILSDQFWV